MNLSGQDPSFIPLFSVIAYFIAVQIALAGLGNVYSSSEYSPFISFMIAGFIGTFLLTASLHMMAHHTLFRRADFVLLPVVGALLGPSVLTGGIFFFGPFNFLFWQSGMMVAIEYARLKNQHLQGKKYKQ